MDSSDPYGLGYRDVDGDPHTSVLVSTMDATAGWQPASDQHQRLLSRAVLAGKRQTDGC